MNSALETNVFILYYAGINVMLSSEDTITYTTNIKNLTCFMDIQGKKQQQAASYPLIICILWLKSQDFLWVP